MIDVVKSMPKVIPRGVHKTQPLCEPCTRPGFHSFRTVSLDRGGRACVSEEKQFKRVNATMQDLLKLRIQNSGMEVSSSALNLPITAHGLILSSFFLVDPSSCKTRRTSRPVCIVGSLCSCIHLEPCQSPGIGWSAVARGSSSSGVKTARKMYLMVYFVCCCSFVRIS